MKTEGRFSQAAIACVRGDGYIACTIACQTNEPYS
jgi:hypothetical protein